MLNITHVPETFAAYKGGQFLASKEAIRAKPLSFWESILSVANGSVSLPGCRTYEDDWARGPEIGAQLERVWHVFFGQPAWLPRRVTDISLPVYLRTPECPGFKRCDGAV